MAWSARRHRRAGPLLVALAGAAAVLAGRVLWSVPAVLYPGVALLFAASAWNLWLERSPRGRLVRVRAGRGKR